MKMLKKVAAFACGPCKLYFKLRTFLLNLKYSREK